jgi:hypothetical protein
MLETGRCDHHQHPCARIREVLVGVRCSAPRERGVARLQREPLTIDFECDLAIEHVEPFVLAGMTVKRRTREVRNIHMEYRDVSICIGEREFDQYRFAEDVERRHASFGR